ncbi:hypothetical protein Nmel_015450 [Mimus melanotis]
MENQITCYEAQMLPELKVTGKLSEEICCSPSPPRLEPVKLKPNKHFRGSKDPLKELILTLKQQQIALKDVITRSADAQRLRDGVTKLQKAEIPTHTGEFHAKKSVF